MTTSQYTPREAYCPIWFESSYDKKSRIPVWSKAKELRIQSFSLGMPKMLTLLLVTLSS